jgi:hypothetical protein
LEIDMREDLDRQPRMLLAFPGSPARWISCRIRHAELERTKRGARILAAEQLAAFSRPELQALFDAARNGPIARSVIGVGLRNAVRGLEGDPLEAFDLALS